MAAPRADGGGILETGMSGALIGSGDAVLALLPDVLGLLPLGSRGALYGL